MSRPLGAFLNSKTKFARIIGGLFIFLTTSTHCQTRLAVTDFQNTSGITKYDALGKALGSMLISDIETNVSPKRIILLERDQITKVFAEQGLQKKTDFDPASAVHFGKLLGASFLITGNLFVLNEQLVINARLLNVETSEIVWSAKVEGAFSQWLSLKTTLAKAISSNLKLPFDSPRMEDKAVDAASLVTFAKAIDEKDKGNLEAASQILETLEQFQPNFSYADDLKKEIDALKLRVTALEREVKTSVEDPFVVAMNYAKEEDFQNAIEYLKVARSRLEIEDLGELYDYYKLSAQYFVQAGQNQKAIAYCDSLFAMYPLDDEMILTKSRALAALNKTSQARDILQNCLNTYHNSKFIDIFRQSIREYAKKQDIQTKVDWRSYGGLSPHEINDCFQIETTHNAYRQGGAFAILLSEFASLDEKLSGIDHTVDYMKNLTMKKVNDFSFTVMEIDDPYYLPKSKFHSSSTTGNELFFMKSSTSYAGDYHEVSDGRLWTKASPSDCPCQLLVKKQELKEIESKAKIKNEHWQISSDDQMHREFSLGWYLMLSRKYNDAIQAFDSVDVYLENKHEFVKTARWFRDFKAMNTINKGHAFLLKGDKASAIKYYNQIGINYQFNEEWSNYTFEEVLKIDWGEFVSRQLISKNALSGIRPMLK